jgi:hypothetical protein
MPPTLVIKSVSFPEDPVPVPGKVTAMAEGKTTDDERLLMDAETMPS